VDRLLNEHAGEVAAVVVEPLVQGAAGIVVHPEGYLKGLREITRRHGTFLIADEVAVGFGKTGTMFACQREAVVPDFLCLAKGLSGGYLPIAATLTTEQVFSAFDATADEDKTFQHGHTFGGNPLGAAVSLANLKVFDEERTLDALPPKIAALSLKLAEFATLRHAGDVRQCGLIAGIELVEDRETKRAFPPSRHIGERICDLARAHGLFIRPIGDVLIVMPPLIITEVQLREMLDVMMLCTRAVTESEETP
jgi:adenosylmethionine-8-amino-7-oxononanoate aminotransferase